jgi:hypothetical protein
MNDISAFLTTTIIQHSYEVESTQTIVQLWDKIRNNVTLKEDLDFVSAVLATGRIMDYKIEIEDLDVLKTIITDIHTNIISRKIESQNLQKELLAALITSASISRSEKVENIRDIVDLWVEIKDGLEIKDDFDVIAAILTTGRIVELKIRAGGFSFINDIYLTIKKEISKFTLGMTITKKELGAAFVTSAYIEISRKVEKIRDIVDYWMKFNEKLNVENQWDFITVILSTGKIKDMDAQHIQIHEGLGSLNGRIREQIKGIVGE